MHLCLTGPVAGEHSVARKPESLCKHTGWVACGVFGFAWATREGLSMKGFHCAPYHCGDGEA
jgi:hypothetical protein